MLNENIRNARKAAGLSQEELAVKLSVVRQTISKWEKGLSVPDADLLLRLSEELKIPVAVLLGETVQAEEPDPVSVLAEKLEVLNHAMAERKRHRQKTIRGLLVAVCVLIVLVYALLYGSGSSYLNWDLQDPETAVAVTVVHGFEWCFVRIAPFVFLGCVLVLVRMRH